MLEKWITGRQGIEQEKVFIGSEPAFKTLVNCFYMGSSCQAFSVFRAAKPPIPEPKVKGHPFAVAPITQHEEIRPMIQLDQSIASCYDPTLITKSKTFHIQSISILLGLKNSCRSRR